MSDQPVETVVDSAPVPIPAPAAADSYSNITRGNANMPVEYTILVERLTGTVKWFNNRAGFGFITVCEPGEYQNKEIFVHWSSIRVSNSQYKYLFQGEYVDFTLVKANNNDHEYQAMNVSGVRGGPIMCETRRTSVSAGGPVQDRPRFRGGPRDVPRGGQRRGPPRTGGGSGAGSGGSGAEQDSDDRRGRSSGDEYRPSRRPPRTPRPPRAAGGAPADDAAKAQQDAGLLDYVKVQSKRTRRGAVSGASSASARA